MKNVLYIGNKLHSLKHNVSYISVLGPLLEHEGLKVRYASSYRNKGLRLLHMVATVLKSKNAIDIVLIDTYSTQNFYFAYILSQCCRLLKIPYVPILHGGNLKSRLEQSPKMSRKLFDFSKVNVAPSLYMKTLFNTHGYNNVTYIPNTLELEDYPYSIKTLDYPRILWVRSFAKLYNPKLAIEVLQNLKATYPKAELCMVGPDSGDGSLAEVKGLCNALNLSVQFTGKLSKKEWIALSENYNTFINTSNFDNMPVSVIEGMALGFPIVSTNVGGMPFLIEHGTDGLLVDKNDADAMTKAIISIFKNENTSKIIRENVREKVKQYDWKHVKTRWFKVLEGNHS